MIEGSVAIIHRDVYGMESIYGRVEVGGVFGETYALLPTQSLMVDVITSESSTILFLDIGKLMQTKEGYAHQAIQNLLGLLAHKNITLSRKITHITPRTIKDRVLSYLQDECRIQNCNEVSLPTQQKLADYLCVDRSALSNVLSKLCKENIVLFDKTKHKYIVHFH